MFEFSLPFSYFGSYWSNPLETPEFSFQWTMSCGNDCLRLDVPFGTVPMSPEPTTYAMLLMGTAGLFLAKKFRRV